MLWQRVLTALVLVPLVVAGILFGSTGVVALVVGGVATLGAWEWARLAGYQAQWVRVGFGALCAAAFLTFYYTGGPQLLVPLWYAVALIWLVTTVLLVMRRKPIEVVEHPRPAMLLGGFLVLLVAWSAVISLHSVTDNGPGLLLFLFVLIWIADSGAYFAGRAFGQRKLSPSVSPGKTWAGVAGAALGTLAAALVLNSLGWLTLSLPLVVLLCLVVTLSSIGGDLFESLLKRQVQLKDSGNLLPGHGGVLDRIDSLLAAAPVFVVGLSILGSLQ